MSKEIIDVRAIPPASSLETAVALAESVVESIQEERLGRAAVLSTYLTRYLQQLAALRFGAAAGQS